RELLVEDGHVRTAQASSADLLGPLRTDQPSLAEPLRPLSVGGRHGPGLLEGPEVHGPLVDVLEAVDPVVLDPVTQLPSERLQLRPQVELHVVPQPPN